VLNTPAVRAAVKDVYCVALEILVDEKLAERWNVAGPPAVVLISSSGEVLSRLSGEITAAQLIDAVQRALAGRQETP
jgi:thiol:disulfide interchange protein